MKVEFENRFIGGAPLFKLLWIGYVFGVGIFLIIPWVFLVISAPFQGVEELKNTLVVIVMMPAVIAGQGLMFAGLIMIGIWLGKRLFKLKVVVRE